MDCSLVNKVLSSKINTLASLHANGRYSGADSTTRLCDLVSGQTLPLNISAPFSCVVPPKRASQMASHVGTYDRSHLRINAARHRPNWARAAEDAKVLLRVSRCPKYCPGAGSPAHRGRTERYFSDCLSDRYLGSLQLLAPEKTAGSRSFPHSFFPARCGWSWKCAFRSAKYRSIALLASSTDL